MVFSSLFFVFFFLTLNLIVYYFSKNMQRKNQVMLVFSLIFYFWAGPKYLLLLLSLAFVSWGFALMISRTGNKARRKTFLILDCVFMLGTLGYFKYLSFFLGITNFIIKLPKVVPEIILPVGISFYTFQLISYVADVYRGEVEAQKKYWKLLLYASLFHQCIAGPIVRYKTVASEIDQRSVQINDITYAIRRFSIGLAKKAILANGCAKVADHLLPTVHKDLLTLPAGSLWLGLLFFSLQIYLDFSAYSDMAIAMGRMIGFHYDENFNYPYIASSVKDFWRRWHISLSTFFRDYVYIPLGGNRCDKRRTILNLLIVWSLTGLWHGASFNYIFWGLYYFVFLVLENYCFGDRFNRLPKVVHHIYTIAVVCFGWVLFRFENTGTFFRVLTGLLYGNGNGIMDYSTSLVFKNNIFLFAFSIAASTPLFKKAGLLIRKVFSKRSILCYIVYVWNIILPPTLLFLSFLALLGNSYNPFLYFRF